MYNLNNANTDTLSLNTETAVNLENAIFDAQLFTQAAQLAIKLLETYLADTSIRGLALIEPQVLLARAKALMTKQHLYINALDTEKLSAMMVLLIKTGIQVHSSGYMGRQFSGVVPLAAVFDFICSVVNQPASFYEAGQLPSVVERLMADEFNRFIGWQNNQFAMVTTSGGSLANLTALLAARNAKYPQFWSKGSVAAGMRPAIALSEDVHYSIMRAIGILGIGTEQIVRLPMNSARQIEISKVATCLNEAVQQGLEVFCIVASAGTTSVGAFDALEDLAKIAAQWQCWLHVDGSHGASLLVSDKLRYKLAGIEQVDSFCLDAHKLLFVPAPCTLLFYKDKAKSYGAFEQQASYVFEQAEDSYTEFDSAKQNFECTKRPSIMNLWVLWALYGKALFADKIEYLCELSQAAYQVLNKTEDFETLHLPESNILCFRYCPANVFAGSSFDFQAMIRKQLRAEGRFFISKVEIDKRTALRVVFMNHRIELKHFCLLLDEIRQIGQALLKTYQS
ncbi:MAG: aminotransferase class V-fold PLP-dependent enzyme [Methylococcaceae bacterium]